MLQIVALLILESSSDSRPFPIDSPFAEGAKGWSLSKNTSPWRKLPIASDRSCKGKIVLLRDFSLNKCRLYRLHWHNKLINTILAKKIENFVKTMAVLIKIQQKTYSFHSNNLFRLVNMCLNVSNLCKEHVKMRLSYELLVIHYFASLNSELIWLHDLVNKFCQEFTHFLTEWIQKMMTHFLTSELRISSSNATKYWK